MDAAPKSKKAAAPPRPRRNNRLCIVVAGASLSAARAGEPRDARRPVGAESRLRARAAADGSTTRPAEGAGGGRRLRLAHNTHGPSYNLPLHT